VLQLGTIKLTTNLLLAPMAGYCDLAFRLVVRSLGGVGAACTDLLNPRGLLARTRKSMELVRTEPADRPLCMQLYGGEPGRLADAARWCRDHGAAVIDLNMGCPADKVVKRQGGADLLRHPRDAVKLAQCVVQAVDVPVTVKMRLGWAETSIVAPRLAAALEDVGVAGITVHGRTAAQKFSGTVQLDQIARVVNAVRAIPVIGNGDIHSPYDAKAMMDHTGCAGVAIGRAALRDPWVFRDTHAFLTTGSIPPPPTIEQRVALMNEHFRNLVRIRGERSACIIFRQRPSWYAGKLGPCSEFRRRIRSIATAADYWKLVKAFAQQACDSARPVCFG
jgi:nifR3 family TIM-barrel protein